MSSQATNVEEPVIVEDKPEVEKETTKQEEVKPVDKEQPAKGEESTKVEPIKEPTKEEESTKAEPTKVEEPTKAEEPAKEEVDKSLEKVAKEIESDHNDVKEDAEEDNLKLEPKRRNAYNYFVSEVQVGVKKENPTATSHEIAKLISAKWKTLTAEQKAPYEDKAALDRKRAKEAKEAKEAGKDKPAEKATTESDTRYSLRSSMVLKGEEIQGKKRGLESEESEESKKQRVTSEE